MCDNCKEIQGKVDSIIEPTEILAELKSTSLPSSDEPIMFFEPIDINGTEKLDLDEFSRGIKEASFACGMYTALLNVGFTQEDAIAYIFNRMNIDNNIEIGKISANATIESSKNVNLAKEKEML